MYFDTSPVCETLRPGWGTNPLLPHSFFLQFSLNWKQKPTVSQQRGDLKVKGQIPLYHGSFWHAESQPMWLETLTDKRRALRTEVKPASESSPLTDDHKTIEKCSKQCGGTMCHVYTQVCRQKALLGGIFKALGWWQSTCLTLQASWAGSCLLVLVSHITQSSSVVPFLRRENQNAQALVTFLNIHSESEKKKKRESQLPYPHKLFLISCNFR